MAFYDVRHRKVVVRVVYDGPGHAGKTTNVRQLAHVFGPTRRTDVVTPEETDGRTQYFDFVQIEGGLVLGHALRCQAIAAPGQAELGTRRMLLLASADAVVFVCAATDEGIAEAAPMYRDLVAQLERMQRAPRPVVIVQLNKMDLANDGVRERAEAAFELGSDVRVILARAAEGVGVRDTIALAMRSAAENAQTAMLLYGVEGLSGAPEDANGLLLAMQRLSELPPASALPGVESDAGPLEPPALDVPPEWIWPRERGREILHRFWSAGPPRRLASNRSSESRGGVTVFESGLWAAHAPSALRFADARSAEHALTTIVERNETLGTLLARNTAVVIGRAPGGAHAIFTIRPSYTTLAQLLEHGVRAHDARSVDDALRAYTSAVVSAMSLAIERKLLLVVALECFASVGSEVYYIHERIDDGERIDSLAEVLLARADSLVGFDAVRDGYLVELECALASRFSVDELHRVGFVDSLRAYAASSPFTRDARARLLVLARDESGLDVPR